MDKIKSQKPAPAKNSLSNWWLRHQLVSVFVFAVILIAVLTIAVTNQAAAPSGPATNLDLPADNSVVTIEGEMVCLPHRDQDGPQTLECAFGLKDGDIYYGLADSSGDYSLLTQAGGGERVRVTGRFNLKEDTKYRSSGVIDVTGLDKL